MAHIWGGSEELEPGKSDQIDGSLKVSLSPELMAKLQSQSPEHSYHGKNDIHPKNKTE